MKKIVQIILFILLGIPGALLFVFASIAIVGKAFDPGADMPNYSSLLIACAVGIVATLIGIGKFKQWLYALVFITFPLSFWLWALINPKMLGGTIVMLAFVGISVWGSYKAVQYYYGEGQNRYYLK